LEWWVERESGGEREMRELEEGERERGKRERREEVESGKWGRREKDGESKG